VTVFALIAHRSTRALVLFATLHALALFTCAIASHAQVPVDPNEAAAVNQAFDAHSHDHSFSCQVQPWGPSLGLDFRYLAGFLVSVSAAQFHPNEQVTTYLRVTPEQASPVLLRTGFGVPAYASGMDQSLDPRDLRRAQLAMSGAFNIGEGRYSVEFLLLHDSRACYKKWQLQTSKYTGKSVALAIQPYHVEPLAVPSWDGSRNDDGLRLTILLDAAPLSPNASRLYAWDRAMLLDALASLLRHLPCRSVQLVVFNLPQQREISRQRDFDSQGFIQLSSALRHLELASVSVRALQPHSAPKFLLQLLNEPVAPPDAADAVIFLGPLTRVSDSIPTQKDSPAQIFYLAFCRIGAPPFPDTIEHLTKALHGSVFHVSSANDLASAIGKIQSHLATPHHSSADSSHLSPLNVRYRAGLQFTRGKGWLTDPPRRARLLRRAVPASVIREPPHPATSPHEHLVAPASRRHGHCPAQNKNIRHPEERLVRRRISTTSPDLQFLRIYDLSFRA
jgi:hypothetical protein